MISESIRKKVKKLRIISYHKATELMAGFYHSAFKGQGLEFEEVREYQPGDDIRNIDWNVTAKTGKPFIKLFREERELTVIFLVDVSASTFFGSNILKKDYIAEICAVLSFAAITNNDKVGIILFSDTIEKFIPPRKGRKSAVRVLQEILSFKPHYGKTNLKMALEFTNKVCRKKSIVFIISDFFASDYEKELSLLASKHDIIGIMVNDILEEKTLKSGIIPVQDIESGKIILVDMENENTQKFLVRKIKSTQEYNKKLFKRIGKDFLTLTVGEDYLKKILELFRLRERRL